jgi:hypothetical protein
MKKTGIPVKGVKPTKDGKLKKTAGRKASVSARIAQRKSKNVKVARRIAA